MSSFRLVAVLIASPLWLAAAPAMAQSASQPTGKAISGVTTTPKQMMQAPGKRPLRIEPQTKVTTAMPLTKGECEGLGGTVAVNLACSKKGQEGCYTVDSDGVIRVACINKIK